MLKISDEVNCPGLLWDCSVQGGVEGECNRLFILQNMPHYSKLHLMTKSQNFHFQLKYHNVSVYTEHPVKEKIWYTLIIREDGESISSMMVSEEWPNFQIIFEYDDWLINILPRIYLMIKFYDYHFLLDTDYWFLLPSIVGERWRKQNNQWDDSHEVWMSRRPRPLCSLESGVSSELWGFTWKSFTFCLSHTRILSPRISGALVSEHISQGSERHRSKTKSFGLLFHVVLKDNPMSMNALCALPHKLLLLHIIHLSGS